MKHLICLFFIMFSSPVIFSQGTWNQITNTPPPVRSQSVAFSIGSKGYIAGGQELLAPPWNVQSDLLQYDPEADFWTELIELPQSLTESVAFTIGSKAYITTGRDTTEFVMVTNLYAWDSFSGSWEIKGPIPTDLIRSRAIGFAIGNKGYITTGYDWDTPNLPTDLWEYDLGLESWTQKADFPGVPRYDASCFVINGKAYITLGRTSSPFIDTTDMWAYDPVSDSWTEKASFPGEARSGAIGFSVGSRGYILCGANHIFSSFYQDVWEYIPDTDQWSEIDQFPGTPRTYASSFVINDKAYINPGYFFGFPSDSWEYTPPPVSIEERQSGLAVYPNPADDYLVISRQEVQTELRIFLVNTTGIYIVNTVLSPGQKKITINVSSLNPGIYFLKMVDQEKVLDFKKIVII